MRRRRRGAPASRQPQPQPRTAPAPRAEFGSGLLLTQPVPEAEQAGGKAEQDEPRVPRAAIGIRANIRARAIHRRRRLAALIIALLLAAAAVAAVALESGAAGPPPDGTAPLVPPDALGYLHLSLDGSSSSTQEALQVARRLPDWPLLSTVALSRVSSILAGGQSVSFSSAVRPWLGHEVGFALLNTAGSRAGTLLLLDVSRPAAATGFVRAEGGVADGQYDGIQEFRYASGTEIAFISHYLVLGAPDGVHSAIDSWHSGQSLASTPSFRAASAGEPSDQIADAYLPAAGVRRLLAQQTGLTGLLGTLLDSPALQGVAVSLSPTAAGARIRVHRALDPSLVALGSRSQEPAFTPSLGPLIPASSLAMLDLRGLDHLVGRVLSGSPGQGFQGRLGSLLAQLGTALTAEGINVSTLTSLFDGESALALVPNPGSAGRSASLLLLTRTSDEAGTREKLAELEAPLAQLFPPPSAGPGRAAVFNDVSVAGVTAHQLILQPGLEFDYAVFHGLVAISTSLSGIAAAAHLTTPLSSSNAFQATLSNRPDQVTSLLFLDFSQLLSLGERAGLASGAILHTLQPDLQRIRAVGLTTTGGEADTTAELSLQIP